LCLLSFLLFVSLFVLVCSQLAVLPQCCEPILRLSTREGWGDDVAYDAYNQQ